MLHALTDSLWLKKSGLSEEEVLRLCETITRETGIEMSLEGLYRWIVFVPSKVKSTRSVAARFYGVFSDGTMKIRGLACRRRDTPLFIKSAQEEMLAALSQAKTLEELHQLREEAAKILEARTTELESGTVDPRLLIVEQVLSRNLEEYSVETRASVAARELTADGINVHPGEKIGYVITDVQAKNPSERVSISNKDGQTKYDHRGYLKKLKAAAAEVAVGYSN